MENSISKRVVDEANYMLKTKDTIRNIANIYNVSKSTVHKDLSERLKKIDENLSKSIENIMQEHIETRHIKGGETKLYKKDRNWKD